MRLGLTGAMRPIALVMAMAGSLAACQVAAPDRSIEAAASSASQSASAVMRGQHTVRERTFVLPPGEWRVVKQSVWETGGSHSAPQTAVILASVESGVIDRVVIIWVQWKEVYRDIWSRYQSCLTDTDPTVHHAVVQQNTGFLGVYSQGNKVDCWHLRTFNLGLSGNPHLIVTALHDYARANKLYLSPVMLGARFAQNPMFDRRDYAEYLWSSDLLLPKGGGQPWSAGEWTAAAARQDPARSAVVNGLKAWAEDWRARYPQSSPSGPTS